MRVLHLNTHSSGGSYECASLLCQALVAEGIQSRLCCKASPQAQELRLLLDRAVRRCYVSLSREPWHGTRRLLRPPQSREVEGLDIVHLHTVADWFDVPRWVDSLPTDVSVVVSLHDMWHFAGGCFLYRGCNLYSGTCAPCPILKAPFNRILAKDEHKRKLKAYGSRRVLFVANSQWLADLAQQSPIVGVCGGARVIPLGIDTTIFVPQDKIQCRAKLGLPKDAFVIAAGAASLTDKNKNVPWLLEQLARLRELEGLIVLVAGEGTLEIPTGLNVRLMGNVSERSNRAMIFSAADVFVSASLMETYGLTLIEAMSCGTPVVAFRVGGTPEAAPEGRGAILCEPGDGAALIEAITKMRDSPHLREDLGRLAHETTHVRNSLNSFSNAFAQLYRDCVRLTRAPSAETPVSVM